MQATLKVPPSRQAVYELIKRHDTAELESAARRELADQIAAGVSHCSCKCTAVHGSLAVGFDDFCRLVNDAHWYAHSGANDQDLVARFNNLCVVCRPVC